MGRYPFVTLRMTRFVDERPLAAVGTGCPVEDPGFWSVGFDFRDCGSTLRDERAAVWCAVGLHRDEDEARAVLDADDRDGTHPDGSDGSGVAERWAAILRPFSHRGQINWLDRDRPGAVVDPGPEPARHEPVVSLTTVGYDFGPGFDRGRVLDFLAALDRVHAATEPGGALVFRHVFNFPATDDVDPMTVSLWRDQAAMRDFAYRPGLHRSEVDRHHQLRTTDRSSFTRLRVVASQGTWGGADPVDGPAA